MVAWGNNPARLHGNLSSKGSRKGDTFCGQNSATELRHLATRRQAKAQTPIEDKGWRTRARVGAITIEGYVKAREPVASETLASAAISVSLGRVRRGIAESKGLYGKFFNDRSTQKDLILFDSLKWAWNRSENYS